MKNEHINFKDSSGQNLVKQDVLVKIRDILKSLENKINSQSSDNSNNYDNHYSPIDLS